MSCFCVCCAALWSPAGKELITWLSFVMFNCVFVIFPCGILGQVWYLIVLIPDLCHHSYCMDGNEENLIDDDVLGGALS